jgi:hypothetical protein
VLFAPLPLLTGALDWYIFLLGLTHTTGSPLAHFGEVAGALICAEPGAACASSRTIAARPVEIETFFKSYSDQ